MLGRFDVWMGDDKKKGLIVRLREAYNIKGLTIVEKNRFSFRIKGQILKRCQ